MNWRGSKEYLPLSETPAQQIQICPQKCQLSLGCAPADSALPPRTRSWPELGLWRRPPCRPGGGPGPGPEGPEQHSPGVVEETVGLPFVLQVRTTPPRVATVTGPDVERVVGTRAATVPFLAEPLLGSRGLL